jgi:hypothetical protein
MRYGSAVAVCSRTLHTKHACDGDMMKVACSSQERRKDPRRAALPTPAIATASSTPFETLIHAITAISPVSEASACILYH